MEKETILRVLVGSQAHGLATPESDFDYRGVFVVPTAKILSLEGAKETTSWIEGKEDDTSWEIGHFLNMAVHCNPTILETFLAPTAKDFVVPHDYLTLGDELRNLFPHIWNSIGVKNAFIGYGMNQRKKFLEDKDLRPNKYAAAYLRSLYNGYELLTTGTFTIRIADTEIGETVRAYKNGQFGGKGDVINECIKWEQKVIEAYNENPNKKTDYEVVNAFLLKVRKHFLV